MLKSIFRLGFFIAFTIPSSFSMDIGQSSFSASAGHISIQSMPKAYQLEVEAMKPLPSLDLDKICPHADVPKERLNAWQPKTLYSQGFMTVMGLSFLDFTPEGFLQQFPGHLKVKGETPDKKAFYFTGLWNSLWLSASLVTKSKYPTAGSYGVVLEIPPELIVKLYQLDSTTMTHSSLFERYSSGEEINGIAKNYLRLEGVYNAEETMEMTDSGPILGSRRIFAPGECENSHPFMTPEEMITRGRPFEHNEIKFVPQAFYRNNEYKVKVSGIWYKDQLHGSLMQSPIVDDKTKKELADVAKEIGVALTPLSQQTLN